MTTEFKRNCTSKEDGICCGCPKSVTKEIRNDV